MNIRMETNPNGSINTHLSAHSAISNMYGGSVAAGQSVVISDVALRFTVNDALYNHFQQQESPVDVENVMKAFYKIMREGRKDGSIFYVGKGYYDITVWAILADIKTSAAFAKHLVGQNDPTWQSMLDRMTIRAAALEQWRADYAKAIGLNEDAH